MDEKTLSEIAKTFANQVGASSVVSISLTTALLRVLVEKILLPILN